ncbi:MAG: sensor histidine kinase [Betaproteobacteria bacterium]
MALLGALAPCAARAVEPAGGPSNVLGLIALATAAGAGAALAGVALAHRLRRNHELQRLQAQLAASVDWTWRIDGQGRLTELAARRPGAPPLDPAALLGRRLWQLLDTRADAPQALEAALAARQPFGGVLLQAAGRALLLAGAPIPQGGCAGTAIDVGALLPQAAVADPALAERTRRLELTARELDSFAYSVSHDLRAPLRVVDGFANILLEDYADAQRPLDDLGREHIRRIITAGNRMNAMIDTLLSMSRMTAADLTRERVDLTHLAQELADELRASDRSRRVQFVIAENLTAEGDRTLLRLVLQNLLGNAFKFTAKATPARIEFSVDDRAARPVYYVRDNGAGFDMRFADKLFGLFQRFHSANEFPGTGVGLATAQRIVRKHGGRIWAASRPGEGATFFFTLWDDTGLS